MYGMGVAVGDYDNTDTLICWELRRAKSFIQETRARALCGRTKPRLVVGKDLALRAVV